MYVVKDSVLSLDVCPFKTININRSYYIILYSYISIYITYITIGDVLLLNFHEIPITNVDRSAANPLQYKHTIPT